MLLIFWVCASTVLCLAILGVAARKVPRLDEEMAAEGEPALRQETAVALGMPETAYAASWSKLASAPLHAQEGKLIHVQPDDLLLSLPSIPVLHPGRAQSCLSPR